MHLQTITQVLPTGSTHSDHKLGLGLVSTHCSPGEQHWFDSECNSAWLTNTYSEEYSSELTPVNFQGILQT